MLVNATEMLIKARDGHYGVPQFNINNHHGERHRDHQNNTQYKSM